MSIPPPPNLNLWGCQPDDDVCMQHESPLICGHGCDAAQPHMGCETFHGEKDAKWMGLRGLTPLEMFLRAFIVSGDSAKAQHISRTNDFTHDRALELMDALQEERNFECMPSAIHVLAREGLRAIRARRP